MSFHEDGITSIIIGILGIIFTAVVAFWVYRLTTNQRKQDQKRHEISTKQHAKILLSNIVKIVSMSEGDNGFPQKIELENRTHELRQFVKRNSDYLNRVAQDTELSLALWLDVSHEEKKEIENIISLTGWILEKYLPQEDESEETQQRRWASKYDELEKRKNQIMESSIIDKN